MAYLAGLASVLASPTDRLPATIGGADLTWTVVDHALPERTGPAVRPLVGSPSFLHRFKAWGIYFLSSPQDIPDADFGLLAGAVEGWRKGA